MFHKKTSVIRFFNRFFSLSTGSFLCILTPFSNCHEMLGNILKVTCYQCLHMCLVPRYLRNCTRWPNDSRIDPHVSLEEEEEVVEAAVEEGVEEEEGEEEAGMDLEEEEAMAMTMEASEVTLEAEEDLEVGEGEEKVEVGGEINGKPYVINPSLLAIQI